MTVFLFSLFSFSIFLSSLGSTYGPFFSERDIPLQPLVSALGAWRPATDQLSPPLARRQAPMIALTTFATPANDELGRALVDAGALAKRRFAPRRLRPGHADTGTTFTTAMRVAAGVHGDTANRWPPAHPALTAGLADLDIAMIGIANLTHRRHALLTHQTNLAARQADLSVATFLRQQLRRNASRTRQLPAAARQQLDVVNLRADRDVANVERVSGAQFRPFAVGDAIANLQAQRRDDVALLAIGVLQQRDTRRAIGIVLNRNDLGGNVKLIPLEVDDAVTTAMTTATMAHGEATAVVATTALAQRFGQRLFRL